MQYVGGMMFTSDRSRVVMVLKSKPEWQAGMFNVIGGKIEKGEEPIDAMVREFREETGIETTIDEWEYFTKLIGPWGAVSFFRSFSDKALTAKTMEQEEVFLLDTLNLPKNRIFNTSWLVPMAADLSVIMPLLIQTT